MLSMGDSCGFRGLICSIIDKLAEISLPFGHEPMGKVATELRISGAVEKLDGDLLALSLSQGISIVVRLELGTACELGHERLRIGSESRVPGERSGEERSKR